jgi:hypothetical protein
VNETENEIPKSNIEEFNNVSNNDINSDTKSFKSLRMNNNFKNENISVIFDTGNDEDMNKSVNTDNNYNLNNIGNKGGFKFLKNKDCVKQGFLKKNQIDDEEKSNFKKDLQAKNTEEDLSLSVINNYFNFSFMKKYSQQN